MPSLSGTGRRKSFWLYGSIFLLKEAPHERHPFCRAAPD